MQGTGAGILRVVLVVSVHRDDARSLRPVFQEPGESGFEGRALAAVAGMLQQMHLGVGRGGLEIMPVFGLASVVDQDDVLKAVCNQSLNHGEELLIRIQRGQNHGNFG